MSLETRVVRARAPYALPRAVAATSVVVAGAASAHTWAGGDVPSGPGLVLVAAAVLGGSLLTFRRDAPSWALLPLVAASQLGVHESFGLASAHDHLGGAAAAGPGWTWQMALAHLFVTVLTAVVWWAGRRLTATAVLVRRRAALPVATRLPQRPPRAPSPSSLVHLLVAPRRGPPRAVLPT